ncbi:hypothetical protein J6R97_00710 [bacterium]|nr:hypothetical protein [bacterium]
MTITIYDKKIDQYLRKYYIKKQGENTTKLLKTLVKDTNEIKKHICSLLLYYDSICMEISAENIAIPFLINLFSEKGFESLLEQGAIRFFLQSKPIMHMVTPVKGVNPLSTGLFKEGPSATAEESINYGLKFSAKQFDRKYKRCITKKVLKCYEKPIDNIDTRVVESVYKEYANNFFKDLGLPYFNELTNFSAIESEKIGQIANLYYDLAIIAKLKYSSIDSFPLHILNNEEMQSLERTKNIEKYTNATFQFEKVPNFEMLLDMGKIKPIDIPKLRNNKISINFRKWITSTTLQDIESFDCKEYLDFIDNNKNFWSSNIGRAIKTISVNTVSGVLLPATGGLSLLGGNIVSLLDEFYLNNLLSWNPRFFFKETINPLLK